MTRYDRLSALIARFEMRVSVAGPGTGNLRILGDAATGAPTRIALCLRGPGPKGRPGEAVLIEADASWGGESNPLVAALPAAVSLPVAADDSGDDTAALVRFLLAEARAARVGQRLANGVHLCRQQRACEQDMKMASLLGVNVDRTISLTFVLGAALAAVAGMSLSRFADAFRARVGETPMAYLRRWRMTLARQDLDRGHRVQAVARRYGYGSSEALARAFQRQHGVNPLAVRRGGDAATAA